MAPKKVFCLALLLTVQSYAEPALTVRPRFVFRGGTVHLLCRVPRDAANRSVRYGLDPDAVSNRDINGLEGPGVFEKFIEDVGCPGPADAFCEVTRNDGKTQRSVQPVEVKGCDTDDSEFGSISSTP